MDRKKWVLKTITTTNGVQGKSLIWVGKYWVDVNQYGNYLLKVNYKYNKTIQPKGDNTFLRESMVGVSATWMQLY